MSHTKTTVVEWQG